MQVTLHVYDLSQGMAASMSPSLLGMQIGGIWHTGLVAFGREYYFGGGICVDHPGRTPYGSPMKTHDMGVTSKSQEEFVAFLRSVSGKYTMATYDLFENNCNNFSDACARYLTGTGVPSYIIDLPAQVLATPMGQMLRPMMDGMQNNIRDASAGHELELGGGAAAPRTGTPSDGTVPTTAAAPGEPQRAPPGLFRDPVRLTTANQAAIRKKLAEFDGDVDPDSVDSLFSFLERAEADKAFPALDLLRLHALEPKKAALIAPRAPSVLSNWVLDESSPRPALMMALRVAVNLLSDPACRGMLLDAEHVPDLAECCRIGLEHENKQIRLAAGALALNMAVAAQDSSAAVSDDPGIKMVWTLGKRVDEPSLSTNEALQLIRALGAFVINNEVMRDFARTLDIQTAKFHSASEPALAQAARELSEVLD